MSNLRGQRFLSRGDCVVGELMSLPLLPVVALLYWNQWLWWVVREWANLDKDREASLYY